MDDELICSEIAYLDDFPEGTSRAELSSHDYLSAVVRAAIQLEAAKQAHWPDADKVAIRLASLESRVEAMRHVMLASGHRYPMVQYVSVQRSQELDHDQVTTAAAPPVVNSRLAFPKSLVVFYTLGLVSSLGFAVVLALSALGRNLIHPFLALLGFVGSIGWLTTAWSDLLLLKAGKTWHQTTTPKSANEAHRSEAGENQQELAKTGKR